MVRLSPRADRVDTLQEVQPLLEPAQRRGLRHVLHPVELAAPADRIHHQHPRQPGLRRRVQPSRDRLAEPVVHLGADRRGHHVQGGVPRQLTPGPDQFFQRHVDQIRRIVLGLHRLADRVLSDLPDPGAVVGDLHPLADELPMPLGRPGRCPLQLHVPAQPQGLAHMPHHHRRHVLDLREIAQPLVGLQPHHQRQQVLLILRLGPRPLHLSIRRSKRLSQLPPRHGPARPKRGYAVRSTEVTPNPRRRRQQDDDHPNDDPQPRGPFLAYSGRSRGSAARDR